MRPTSNTSLSIRDRALRASTSIVPNQTNVLAWTWTISPSLINELRGTVSIDRVYIPVNTALAGFNRGTLGINFPYIVPGAKAAPDKIPTVTVPNFYGLAGGPYPSHSQGPIYTITDSVTKVWGRHTVKAGVYFNYQGENDNDQINVSTVPGGANNQNGSFVFTDTRNGLGGTTGAGIANLALGLADSYTEIGPKAYTSWTGQMYEEFIQDSWTGNAEAASRLRHSHNDSHPLQTGVGQCSLLRSSLVRQDQGSSR